MTRQPQLPRKITRRIRIRIRRSSSLISTSITPARSSSPTTASINPAACSPTKPALFCTPSCSPEPELISKRDREPSPFSLRQEKRDGSLSLFSQAGDRDNRQETRDGSPSAPAMRQEEAENRPLSPFRSSCTTAILSQNILVFLLTQPSVQQPGKCFRCP